MSEFESTSVIEANAPPAHLAGVILKNAYREYVAARDCLYEEQEQPTQEAMFRAQATRESVAKAASFLRARTLEHPSAFTYYVQQAMPAGATPIKEARIPLPNFDKTIPTPAEAIVATWDNLIMARKFAEAGKATLTGMLVSGSTSWGEYFAPRGDHRLAPYRHGIQGGERSDVDLVAVTTDVDAIGATISAYVDEGLVDLSEQLRFEVFSQLYNEGKADVFSLRARHGGGEQSLHFLTEEIMETLSKATAVRSSEQGINVVHDFRPNKPNNPGKNGLGYSVDDLKGLHKGYHMPTPKTVTHNEELAGYISDAPAGTIINTQGEQTYLMGLVDFFIAIKPCVVHDTNEKLATWIRSLQRTIAEVQQGETPTQIPRQKRMAKYMLTQVREELTTP